MSAYFEEQGGLLVPRRLAASSWSQAQLRGPAIAGALARRTESVMAALDSAMRPTRFTLDLFRPVPAEPAELEATLVRRGRRLVLIDAFYRVDGKCVARSSTLLLAASETPAGDVWSAGRHYPAPPQGALPDGATFRIHHTSADAWGPARAGDASAPNCIWQFGVPVVEGQALTPFQAAASAADVSNLVSNWGTGPLSFINADVTLALIRLPVETEVGLAVTDRIETEGISVGSLAMYDRAGVFGTTTVLSLANGRRAVDPSASRGSNPV